jgi:hypothetical protein
VEPARFLRAAGHLHPFWKTRDFSLLNGDREMQEFEKQSED